MILILACGGQPAGPAAAPTRTRLPTFTPTFSPTPRPVAAVVLEATLLPVATAASPATATFTPTSTPLPTDTPEPAATPTVPPPTATPSPAPAPTDTPTITPTPEPIVKYVLAAANREFNCDFTYVYGTVQNANNFPVAGVEVRALGIHDTTGLDFTVSTDADGRYEAFRFPLAELPGAQWAVLVMEDGREVSERFHWTSTPVCNSDDTGHSQVLRVDWKLIE